MTAALPMTPARRVILAIGVPLVLAVIALSTRQLASKGVSDLVSNDLISHRVAFSVPARGGQVRVTASNASIALAAGGGAGIRVSGTVTGSYRRATISRQWTTAGLSLSPQCPVQVGDCSANLAIAAPPGLPATVSTSFGDLSATSLHGTIALSDNSGDLSAARLTGSIQLTDAYGDITASDLAGSIRLGNDSGDISAAGLTGNTRLASSFGDIKVTGLAAADVIATNNSGDIDLTFTRVPQRVDVTDAFGDITLRLPPGPAAYQVHARTSFATKIVSVPQSATSPDVITVTNNSGNITIVN